MLGVRNHASVTTKNWPAEVSDGTHGPYRFRISAFYPAPFRTTEASRRKLSLSIWQLLFPIPHPSPDFSSNGSTIVTYSRFFVFSLAAHDDANTEKLFQNRLRRQHLFLLFLFSLSVVFIYFISLFTDNFYFFLIYFSFFIFLLLWPGQYVTALN